MPELPEVEHIRLTLLPLLVGRRIDSATLRRRDVLVTPADPAAGFGRARAPTGERPRPGLVRKADLFQGASVADIRRHGKQLALIAADGRVLCVHLGMTGQLFHVPPLPVDAGRARLRDTHASRSDPHVHASWTLDSGARLVFRDPRRFGGLWSFPSVEALETARWSALGPDALAVTPTLLGPRLARTARPIKAALLDQAVLAGVGNIYADESLFLARLHPATGSDRLTPREVARLATAIRGVLACAVAAGGSTLRDYVDANGEPGRHQLAHNVYGRAGLPCPACGACLARSVLAQRTTVWCSKCQVAVNTNT